MVKLNLIFILLYFFSAPQFSLAEENCNYDLGEVLSKAVDGVDVDLGRTQPEPPVNPPQSRRRKQPPQPPLPPRSEPNAPYAGSSGGSDDSRGLGDYYYNQSQERELNRREQRLADSYKERLIEARKYPVDFGKGSGLTPRDTAQISSALQAMGVPHDSRNGVLLPQSSKGQDLISLQDRVRDIIRNEVTNPLNVQNQKIDKILNALSTLHKRVEDDMKRKYGGRGSKDPYEPNLRNLASLGKAISSDDLIKNPLVLDEIVNKASYIKDGVHWRVKKQLSRKQSKDPLTRKAYAKDIYWYRAGRNNSPIRILEFIDKKDRVSAIKVFSYSKARQKWMPYFYKKNFANGQFIRTDIYHGKRLPQGCVSCHGQALRSLSPELTLSPFRP